MEVGIRDLRNHLSQYVDKVRQGQEVVVTDRGRAVARMVPLSEERRIDRLIAEGVIIPAPQDRRTRPRHRIEGTEPISSLIGEQRR
jgi:prevent-host-death family protein